jgi:hypothetical protein
MAKSSPRLEAARRAYREALEAARSKPTPDAWARLLAAGKELSSAEESRPRSRRGRRPAADRVEPAGEVEPIGDAEPDVPTEQASGDLDGADPG